jgi:uncharacterized protein (TIGR02145 family)
MAYFVKYRCEFKDFLGLDWSIDFLKDLTSQPVIINLIATGNPLNIEYNSDSDEFNEPVRTSKAVMNVYSETDFQLTEFFSVQDFEFKINVYCNSHIYWTGFNVTAEYSEPYDCVPYPVALTAIDGISYLKKILFAEEVAYTTPAGSVISEETVTYYNGRRTESQIIFDILGKVYITGFGEYVNIYESNMDSDLTDSPLDQAYLDVDVFRGFYCWDVLQEILKKYNAVIRQWRGEMVIYRPIELTQALVYGRIFTSAVDKIGTNFAPIQNINRVATPSNLLQFPGSALMIKSPAKKIVLNQDYGYKKSWIDNWEFKADTYLPAPDLTFEDWTLVNTVIPGTGFNRTSNVIPGEDDGIALPGVLAEQPNIYVYQQFGDNALITSDVFIFSFDYLHYNSGGTSIDTAWLYMKVMNVAGTKWLSVVDADTLEWVDSEDFVGFNTDDVIPGSNGWATFQRKLVGLEAVGPYVITLYLPIASSAGLWTVVKNIVFQCTSDEIVVKKYPWYKFRWLRKIANIFMAIPHSGVYSVYHDLSEIVKREYIIVNALNGKELEYDYMLGDVADAGIDNVIEQFAGSIGVGTTLINSSVWNTADPGGEADPLLEIIGGEIGLQFSRPTQFIDMNIQEMDPDDIVLNVIGSFQDILNLEGSSIRIFVFNAGNFNVKMRKWQADLLEIIPVTPAVIPSTDLVDLDGNIYTVITIGNFELIAQNFKCTKYSNGDNILNLTSDGPVDLLTGWTNIDFDTFSTLGKNILSAIETESSVGHADTNSMALMDGDVLNLEIDLTLVSGDLPRVSLYKDGTLQATTVLDEGLNSLSYNITEDNDYTIRIFSQSGGTEFHATCLVSSDLNTGWAENIVGAYCWYNNDVANKISYGALYNWYAINVNFGRELAYLERGGVQEPGWVVPTQSQWEDITDLTGGESIAGGFLKETGTTHWITPNDSATDTFGFKGVPGGMRDDTGTFSMLGYYSDYWCSDVARYKELGYNDATFHDYSKAEIYGFSVRLIREITPSSTSTQYVTLTDPAPPKGTGVFRKGVRDGMLRIDVALTSSAFAGIEDTDWKNLTSI